MKAPKMRGGEKMYYKQGIVLGMALCMVMSVGCNKQTEKQTVVDTEYVADGYEAASMNLNDEMRTEQQTQLEDQVNKEESADLATATNAAQEGQEMKAEEKMGAKIFTRLSGKMTSAGILFDDDQTMYVAVDKGLFKVTPDGNVSPFCLFEDMPAIMNYCYPSPTIWDMTFDKEHNILAAAQDRILKISLAGEVTELAKEGFSGFLGTSDSLHEFMLRISALILFAESICLFSKL